METTEIVTHSVHNAPKTCFDCMQFCPIMMGDGVQAYTATLKGRSRPPISEGLE